MNRTLRTFALVAFLMGGPLVVAQTPAPAPGVDPKPPTPAVDPRPKVVPSSPPRAVITAPAVVAEGNDIVLRADQSVGTKLSWQLISPKVPFEVADTGGRAASRLIVPKPPAGTYKFALVAIGSAPDVFDTTTAEVPVVATPDNPTPGPIGPVNPITPVVPAGDASPRAVAVARPSFPSGAMAFVDATGSRSADPLQFQVLGQANTPSIRTESGMGIVFPALPDGRHVVAVTATAPRDFAGPRGATAVVEFTIGVPAPVDPLTPDNPTPGPTPVPTPTPGPAPATPLQAIGKAYAVADVQAMAATYEESATMLAAGNGAADVAKSFGDRWKAKRTPAFAPAGAAFAAILPAGQEPKDQATRDAMVGAWRDFAAGLRLGVR